MLLRSSLDRIDLSGNRKKEDVDMIGIILAIVFVAIILMLYSTICISTSSDKKLRRICDNSIDKQEETQNEQHWSNWN